MPKSASGLGQLPPPSSKGEAAPLSFPNTGGAGVPAGTLVPAAFSPCNRKPPPLLEFSPPKEVAVGELKAILRVPSRRRNAVPVSQFMEDVLTGPWFGAQLLAGFGALALLLAACWLPTHRAMRVDSMITLRFE